MSAHLLRPHHQPHAWPPPKPPATSCRIRSGCSVKGSNTRPSVSWKATLTPPLPGPFTQPRLADAKHLGEHFHPEPAVVEPTGASQTQSVIAHHPVYRVRGEFIAGGSPHESALAPLPSHRPGRLRPNHADAVVLSQQESKRGPSQVCVARSGAGRQRAA